MKEAVRNHWNHQPCGTRSTDNIQDRLEYFDYIAKRRYKLEPFIPDYANPHKWMGKDILEVGCGVGTDSIMFAKNGATVKAIDLSDHSVSLTRNNFKWHRLTGYIQVADAEKLPFRDNSFDFVYSWGVLHHTPNTQKAIDEIYRVLKPDGEICIMLYNRYSLVSLQMYLVFGLLRLNPFAKLDDLFSKYHESPGTKVYSNKEIKRMFMWFNNIRITNQMTPYDLRIGRNTYLPIWDIPLGLGFFNVIKAKK